MLQAGNDPLNIINALRSLGELTANCDTSQLPSLSALKPDEIHLSWDLKLKSTCGRQELEAVFDWVEDDCNLVIIPMFDSLSEASAPSIVALAEDESVEVIVDSDGSDISHVASDPIQIAAPTSNSIRVETHKIDRLINMIGELVITQSMLDTLGENFSMTQLGQLQEGLEQLKLHTSDLHEGLMQVRMLPISFAFNRFPRMVHDLSLNMGKQITLELSGEETEVDKTVIEKIVDPLVHLVRNSLDHGLETPEQRILAGKPESGLIKLSAYHKGGYVFIEIQDDGRGLDRERIFQKAVAKGLAFHNQKLSDEQLYEVIFHPGFSTADEVNDMSGRGVGMDVVRRNINELGGSIQIESEQGVGSRVKISLPLTLAILEGQIINVGGEVFIVPLLSIIESIQPQAAQISRLAGKGEAFKLRSEYIPVIRIADLFDIKQPSARSLTEGLLVIVEGDGRRCALLVDQLLGQKQVVIKSLEENYQRVEGVSGATILGDGSVALIMDVPGLISLAGQGRGMRMSA